MAVEVERVSMATAVQQHRQAVAKGLGGAADDADRDLRSRYLASLRKRVAVIHKCTEAGTRVQAPPKK
jgi:hypothetical protein